ncbi:Uncharacterized protein TCAP_01669 [Tolypocladium capitatum]|uniref:C2H2-type domain-containing protein n=1 Tax=Tolypocladium capitatum TaxID=45235 RepID=A0A2K3QLL2_9HYPO|nr:Uncharacterized protein TCAP_01669 [Tolypocladium capitatum]
MQTMDFANTPYYYDDSMASPLGMYGDGSSSSSQHYRSEPLSRYGSSEGSTQGSSTVASPLPGHEYYTFDDPSSSCTSPHTQQAQMSPGSTTIYRWSPDLDAEQDMAQPRASSGEPRSKSSQSGRDYPVCCLHPGCTAKPFKRRADLDRHYKHRHAPESQKESFNCDYPRCARRSDPFHRLDHYRDHLREFHKEDIEKRGGTINEIWVGDRHVTSNWWRCSKCLKRIYINRNGYECPNCKTHRQAKQKEVRRKDRD